MTNAPDKSCPACGADKIIRRLPREIDRRLDYEEITLPDEPEKRRKLAILRVTYERDFICTQCSYQWSEEYILERQQEA